MVRVDVEKLNPYPVFVIESIVLENYKNNFKRVKKVKDIRDDKKVYLVKGN